MSECGQRASFNCACSSVILALLRTEFHFGLLHLLDVFGVGSQLCQSLTSQPVRMSNAVLSLPAGAGEEFRSLDATPFSTPDPVHPAVPDLIRPSKSEVRNSSHASIVRTSQAIASQLLTFSTSSLVPLQRLNDSRVQRFNAIRRGPDC